MGWLTRASQPPPLRPTTAFKNHPPIDAVSRQQYIDSMKVKTSITLSEELLHSIDKRARQFKTSRSGFIETALRAFVEQLAREELNARDLEIINRRAKFLNREAADVLTYPTSL